jgi:hypothetical protein
MLYLKTDVLLLADVFVNFRKMCLNYYKLDPSNYLSAPALAWDAMLLKTGIELDLIHDVELLNVIERQKRGGLCFVGSKRYVKANNKYVEDFDITKPSSYIMYWDANNLYGWAMSQILPYRNIRFNTTVKIEEVLATPDDSDTGYIVVATLRYPEHLHEKFKEYPPCPENLSPKIECFSQYQKDLGKELNIIKSDDKYAGCDKLVPHLYEHKDYAIHYRNLKFIKDLGVEIVKCY